MTDQHITLLQPRHTYAPSYDEERIGHIYMPTSLLSVAARMLRAGLRVKIVDENFDPWLPTGEWVGVNLVGAPYVPATLNVIRRARNAGSPGVLLGGQVISGFSATQFASLFGPAARNGESSSEIEAVFGLEPGSVGEPDDVSLISSYKLLTQESLRAYLSNELPFFVSRGCRHSCTFCAARRSVPGKLRIRESYRHADAMRQDLLFLKESARSFGIDVITLYLTNLDLFQTPERLAELAGILLDTHRANPHVQIRFRALSNVESFVRTHNTRPQLIRDLVDAGLYRLGFGIDGAEASVFQSVRKPHNGTDILEPFRLCTLVYGITPETLMVFGHVGIDSEHSMAAARDFAYSVHEQYGALARPHVAKSVVPGNDGWRHSGNNSVTQFLINNPDAFQMLDFTATPSWLTHPEPAFRAVATKYFIETCEIPGAVTQYVLPEDPVAEPQQIETARGFNKRRYDI